MGQGLEASRMQGGKVIYVVQDNTASTHKVLYAGSSAHDAMLVAANRGYVMISIFKNGKRFFVEQEQSAKGSS